jgi:hypothetical protein
MRKLLHFNTTKVIDHHQSLHCENKKLKADWILFLSIWITDLVIFHKATYGKSIQLPLFFSTQKILVTTSCPGLTWGLLVKFITTTNPKINRGYKILFCLRNC